MRRYQIIMGGVGDRLHWVGGAGDDLVGAYYRLGIRCYTSSISNVAPRLSLALHDVAAAGDEKELTRLIRQYVVPLYAFRARRKGYEVTVMKAMMTPARPGRRPVAPAARRRHAAEMEELRRMLDGWKDGCSYPWRWPSSRWSVVTSIRASRSKVAAESDRDGIEPRVDARVKQA